MQCPNCNRTWPDEFRGCPICMVPLIAQIGEGASGAIAQQGSVAAATGSAAVGGDVGGHIIIAESGATVVVGELPVTMTAVDRESALGRYLHHVISRNHYLQLQGIRSGGKLVHIELDQIYVTLRATRQRVVQREDEAAQAEIEAGLAPGEYGSERFHQPFGSVETVNVSVNEALAAYSRPGPAGRPAPGRDDAGRDAVLLYPCRAILDGQR